MAQIIQIMKNFFLLSMLITNGAFKSIAGQGNGGEEKALPYRNEVKIDNANEDKIDKLVNSYRESIDGKTKVGDSDFYKSSPTSHLWEKLDDLHMEALADALLFNDSVEELVLDSRGITDKGVEHLAYALRINGTLKKINLAQNKISDKGADHLGKALQFNKTLKILNLDYNQITQKGAAPIQASKYIESISFKSNYVEDKTDKLIISYRESLEGKTKILSTTTLNAMKRASEFNNLIKMSNGDVMIRDELMSKIHDGSIFLLNGECVFLSAYSQEFQGDIEKLKNSHEVVDISDRLNLIKSSNPEFLEAFRANLNINNLRLISVYRRDNGFLSDPQTLKVAKKEEVLAIYDETIKSLEQLYCLKDGCKERAWLMALNLKLKGIASQYRYLLLGKNRMDNRGMWGFHATTVVRVEDASGNISLLALDPLLGPLEIDRWDKAWERDINALDQESAIKMQPNFAGKIIVPDDNYCFIYCPSDVYYLSMGSSFVKINPYTFNCCYILECLRTIAELHGDKGEYIYVANQ